MKRPAALQEEAGQEAGMGNKFRILKTYQEEMTGLMRMKVLPLFAGVAEAGTPVTNPDGARTIPGWPTPTGPSRPMMSVSLVLLA